MINEFGRLLDVIIFTRYFLKNKKAPPELEGAIG